MGKMGEAANLGAVAIVGLIVLKLMGMPKLELPKLPMLFPSTPELPRAREIFDVPDVIDDTLMIDVDPFIPAPTIADLGLLDPVSFRDTAAEHAARLAASQDVLEAAKVDLARFQTYVNGNADIDAGGSTDMVPPSERYVNGVWLVDH